VIVAVREVCQFKRGRFHDLDQFPSLLTAQTGGDRRPAVLQRAANHRRQWFRRDNR